MPDIITYLDAHLDVDWLRPEKAVCDAIMSARVSEYPLRITSLDMGCGDGRFMWVTLGQQPNQMLRGLDISLAPSSPYLRVYREVKRCDGNHAWPLPTDTFEYVFSNMLYWLNSPDHALSEVARVLRPGGHAVLCLQDPGLPEYRLTRQFPSLDCGRSKDYKWSLSRKELEDKLNEHGLYVVDFRYYWTPTIVKVWDTGLRLLSKPLYRMWCNVEDDSEANDIKSEWIAAIRPFLIELCLSEPERPRRGGHQLVYVEKR